VQRPSPHLHAVAQLTRAALDELDQLLLDRLVERRLPVAIEQLAPAALRALGIVEGAVTPPAVDVVRRANGWAPEALAEPLERVRRAEEVAPMPDFEVRIEGQRRLVDDERLRLL